MARLEFCRSLDVSHVRLHPGLHARVFAHRRRNELGRSNRHHLPGQPHRAHRPQWSLNAHAGAHYGIPFPCFTAAPRTDTVRRQRPCALTRTRRLRIGSRSRHGSSVAPPVHKILSVFFPAMATKRTNALRDHACHNSSASSSFGASTCGSSTKASTCIRHVLLDKACRCSLRTRSCIALSGGLIKPLAALDRC